MKKGRKTEKDSVQGTNQKTGGSKLKECAKEQEREQRGDKSVAEWETGQRNKRSIYISN